MKKLTIPFNFSKFIKKRKRERNKQELLLARSLACFSSRVAAKPLMYLL